MPVQLIAKVKFPYDGKTLLPGDTFIASQNDSVLLIGMGSATRALPPPEPISSIEPVEEDSLLRPMRALSRRDLAALDNADNSGDKRKRVYKRRDLVAEGDE